MKCLISLLLLTSLTSNLLHCSSGELKQLSSIGNTRSTYCNSKIRRSKRPTSYYANSTSSLHLILSGDIEKNPGPTNRNQKSSKCTVCEKTVRCNSKHVLCLVCKDVAHLKCIKNCTTETEWTCLSCIHTVLPFSNCYDLNSSSISDVSISSAASNTHLEVLKRHQNHTSFAHLNVQSLTSTFDEFSFMLQTFHFDIIALSETWLKDNKHQINYVQIAGYNTVFRHREAKGGGGVGFYIKDHMHYKIRKDLNKIEESLETMWVEIRGQNKNSAYLVCAVYQPSSVETERLSWLEKFDELLSEVCTKWGGAILLAGDLNIDLLSDKNESTRRYKELLHNYSLHQHITQPTRKSKTLIDHVISNIPNKVIHTDVINTDEISDHDMPYAIINVKKQRYEPCYKYIRDEKKLDMNEYVTDFCQIPFQLVYAFDDPGDQIDILNKLILDCIEQHAPLKKVKITRPITQIVSLK